MKHDIKRINWILLMFVYGIIVFILIKPVKAFAASATIGFEVDTNPIMTGDMVTISITIDTDTLLGDFEGNMEYNPDVLEYVSGPSCIAGGEGMLRILDIGASSSWTTRSYVLTFRAIGIGDSVLKMTGTPAAYSYEDGMPMSVSHSSKTVTVTAPATASVINELEILKINPGTLTPTFDAGITEYSTIVEADTKRLIISAITKDMKANVKITGNQDFVVGSNYVTITVTAESGDQKDYIIHVVKEDKTPVVEEIEEEDEAWAFHADKEGDRIYLQGRFTYKVVSETETISIPEGYIKSSIQIDGTPIPIYQLKDNVEDDYLLIILENQFGQINLYRYDRVEKTIQRYTGDRVLIQEGNGSEKFEYAVEKKQLENKISRQNIYLIILAGLSALLLIGIISIFVKYRFHKEDEF